MTTIQRVKQLEKATQTGAITTTEYHNYLAYLMGRLGMDDYYESRLTDTFVGAEPCYQAETQAHITAFVQCHLEAVCQ